MSNMMSQHVAYQLFASRLANSHSTTDSPHGLMEPVEGELQGLNVGSSNLLGLPETCPWDSDDELLGIGGIKPKSSPIPRRRSSLSCSDDEAQPPPSSSRRVSFADAFGLSLVSVKQFDTWSMCDPSDPLEIDPKDAKEYYLELLFALPLTLEELLYRVQEQKVDLESLELLPGTTTLKGTVRVLNLCFDKLVYIRTSLDCWSSHFDLLAEYVPESSQGVMDCFSFKLTLVPPFGEQGERVDFCIRYETPFGTFWANNSGQNYVLFCHEKAKDQDENEKLKPKSCLKPSRHSSTTSTTSNAEEIPEIILNCGIAAVTEPVGVKEEKLQEEHMNLKEENSKNCSRRKRRKAARMAKLQQYFAQRDGKDLQQIETDTDEVDVPVPAIDEAPLNLSSPQTNVSSLLAEPRNTEGQKSIAGSMDVEKNQVPDAQTQTEERDNIPVIHPELITSKSQTRQPPLDSVNSHTSVVDSQLLESSQDEETVTSQSVSHKCQTSDKSIVKTVEKAWECFEKCAMEKMGSTADTNSSVDKTNHVDNTLLENNQGTWSFGHHYTFETIVAPLYHQVFERMENDRRGVKNSTSQADESAGKIDDGSLSVVTYPRVATSNPENPEDASQEEEEIKENDQVKNPDNNEEQELTDMTENQSEEVKEIREVEKQIEEKEEQEDNKQEDQVEKEQENDEKVELGIEDKFKDGSYYPEDDKEEVKKDEKEKDAEPRRNGVEWEALETEIEEQEMDGGVTSVATLQSIPNIDSFIRDVHLHVGQEQQNTGLEQTSEEPVSERHSTGEEEESFCGKDSSQQALTLSSDVAFSDQVEEIENISEFIDQEEDVCCQIDEEHVVEDAIGEVDAVPEKQERDCVNEQSENMDDSASTESLTDDEMELYLLRLKNIEQSGLKDAISMGKRHSISRTWTIPSPMPSISEYIDEDQPNALLDDLTNEEMIELERAALPLLDEEQEVTEPNLLWWREFFSSDNMPKMILYTLLFVVFLITTYICDFIACFGLYLLALYWLYFQVQREPLKGT
ncbi:hypothetical protein PHYPO_G00225840 [Pangasianodon hypophthalmus]|uniref:CBM21 domain-containing protein n=1 Tax=Pangasianodon hypophthalmus TaxID=310915 RepID=A0A5N5NWC5_PANHP|nr:hypothetical protein PHYPO_G00225840 [Pangasianodon hypophthalmus]